MFLEPKRKQREEQESTAELSEHFTEKGMVAPTAVSAFQPLGKIPAQDLSGSCFKSLPSALKGYRYLPLGECAKVWIQGRHWHLPAALVDCVPVTNKILVRFPFPTCLPEYLHLRDTWSRG